MTTKGYSQNISGPSDISRIKSIPKKNFSSNDENKIYQSQNSLKNPIIQKDTLVPKEAKNIIFTLKEIELTGQTAFSKQQLSEHYKDYLNKEISLAKVYSIAEKITKQYHEAGYFLSSAFVPPQNIANGIVKITISEGSINHVDFPETIKNKSIFKQYVNQIINKKPIKSEELESFLLRLNDLPGYIVTGTLTKNNKTDGSVNLLLETTPKEATGQIGIDNYSSRFLGTNEMSATYSKSFIPLHQTTLSAIQSLSFKRLSNIGLYHKIAIIPDFTLDFAGSYTESLPGLNLDRFHLKSNSSFFSTGFNYQWLRQRNENLSLGVDFDVRNTNSDILKTANVRDRIRALRLGGHYDIVDKWNGFNLFDFTFSQGIDGLGSNRKNDKNLSRAMAIPDFRKIELSVTHFHRITDDISVLLTSNGQYASGPLFSAEEFGYGGQNFGRAFDASELTGDHGIASSIEFRYNALENNFFRQIQPYVFYDVGRVWNEDIAQVQRISAASMGIGTRFATKFGLNANLGLSMPLVRAVQNPIYGQGNNEPRLGLQLFQQF